MRCVGSVTYEDGGDDETSVGEHNRLRDRLMRQRIRQTRDAVPLSNLPPAEHRRQIINQSNYLLSRRSRPREKLKARL